MAHVLKYLTAEHHWGLAVLAGALCLFARLARVSTETIVVAVVAMLATHLLGVAVERRVRAGYRKQNHRLTVALNNMSQGLCMFDAASRLVVCNRRYMDMYGLSADA